MLRQEKGLPKSRLEAAGYLGAEHRGYLAGVERQMREWGLGDEFRYHGAVDRAQKIEFLRGLDVLSVPGPYPDPKGTYLLEAMAAGTPVVQPRRGAYVETIERTGGGLLVEPTTDALAEGLLSSRGSRNWRARWAGAAPRASRRTTRSRARRTGCWKCSTGRRGCEGRRVVRPATRAARGCTAC